MIAWLKNTLQQFGLEYFNKYYSIYRGEVSDNKDPENKGRIKLKIKNIYGNDVLDYWALPKGMIIGKGLGVIAIPAIGDLVWVTFESGDPRFPVWEHGWFKENLKELEDSGQENLLIIKSRNGSTITLEDKKEYLELKHENNKILINKDGVFINTEDEQEKAVLGNTLEKLLHEFLTDIGTISGIPTPTGGITSPISSAPNFISISAKWKQKWSEIKSKKINLK